MTNSDANNSKQMLIPFNNESVLNMAKEMDPNIDAIEITVTPDMSNLGNLIQDIEKTIEDNKRFQDKITKEVEKNKNENSEFPVNEIEVAANKRKDILIKRFSKIAILFTVLFGLIVTFIVLLSNIGEEKEKWPQTV